MARLDFSETIVLLSGCCVAFMIWTKNLFGLSQNNLGDEGSALGQLHMGFHLQMELGPCRTDSMASRFLITTVPASRQPGQV